MTYPTTIYTCLSGLLLGVLTSPAALTGSAATSDSTATSVSAEAFELKLRPAPKYEAGKRADLWVVLEAKAPYHVNQAYPYRFTPQIAPEIEHPREAIDKSRVTLDEMHAAIPVVFTPRRAGRFNVGGNFAFSVCTHDKCLMEKRALEIAIEVK